MFQCVKEEGRYPDHLTLGWLRSDGDLEIVGTLNGETIADDQTWNSLVERTLAVMQYVDPDTKAYEREDVVSVLTDLNPDDPDELKEVPVAMEMGGALQEAFGLKPGDDTE
jgi:hypothetical protein